MLFMPTLTYLFYAYVMFVRGLCQVTGGVKGGVCVYTFKFSNGANKTKVLLVLQPRVLVATMLCFFVFLISLSEVENILISDP